MLQDFPENNPEINPKFTVKKLYSATSTGTISSITFSIENSASLIAYIGKAAFATPKATPRIAMVETFSWPENSYSQ